MKWLLVLIAMLVTGPASAVDDDEKQQKLIRSLCAAGRVGMSLKELMDIDDPENLPTVYKNIVEGCRQETVKDLSCYPFTTNGKDRTIFMPGDAPSNAKFEPLTADCKGRVGRWPAWSTAKEDRTETFRMGAFYVLNPPGELPPPRSLR